MTRILAIDPGTHRSAWLVLAGDRPTAFGIEPNDELVAILRGERGIRPDPDVLVIEEITSYGTRPVGRETFQTMRQAGRFEEALHGVPTVYVPRGSVARHFNARGDAGVRAAVIDRFGGKDHAIGRKAAPGPLYGIHADVWSALALAIAYQEGAK